MVYITKTVEFSASHRLFNPLLTDEENCQIFDKCNNPHGHGHNYVLEVTVAGEPDITTGYLIDLKKMKTIINDEIIQYVDHKHLNYDVDFLSGVIPTVENMVLKFWERLDGKFNKAKLYRLRLYETQTSFVEYFGN
jgi:6-pyruvoyltetrahydropterin/6-carboxytetrahydropterin synthase